MEKIYIKTFDSPATEIPCVDEKPANWCYIVGQARLCVANYYKNLCCATCLKMTRKPR